MLEAFNVENFHAGSAEALLVMRQSIRNRDARDFLCLEGPSVYFGGFRDMTGGKDSFTVETRHRIKNSTERDSGRGISSGRVDRFLCDGMDFRELCRIFGERFAAVAAFELKTEFSFRSNTDVSIAAGHSDHVLSYMKIETTCERVYEEDRTAFFELVRYRGGDNFDLYWDGFPDIDLRFTDGRAKGCNAFIRSLAVYDIQSDGVPDGVRFRSILPVITAFSRIAVSQFDYILPFDGTHPVCRNPNIRSLWASPDGNLMFSPVNEGAEVWLSYFKENHLEGNVSLIERVISALPGTTFVLPEMEVGEGDRVFLEQQKTVRKNWLRICVN